MAQEVEHLPSSLASVRPRVQTPVLYPNPRRKEGRKEGRKERKEIQLELGPVGLLIQLS
jgi:hypothetical protein